MTSGLTSVAPNGGSPDSAASRSTAFGAPRGRKSRWASGGWVSMKGGTTAVRPARSLWRRTRPASKPARRPWWARLLAARTLQSLVG